MHYEQIVKIKIQHQEHGQVYGTGYRISQYHILTANHVVDDPFHNSYEFTCTAFPDVVITDPPDIQFQDENFDVAIIEIDKEKYPDLPDVHTPKIGKMTAAISQWLSAGFPKWVEDESGEREKKKISGTYNGYEHPDKFYEIECTTEVDEPVWNGVSGAPIIDYRTGELTGVIKTFDERTTKTTFDACAIWLLSGRPDFYRFFKNSHYEYLAGKINYLIAENESLRQSLGNRFPECNKNNLVEKLLQSGSDDVIELCRGLKSSNHDQNLEKLLLNVVANQFTFPDSFNQAHCEDKPYITVPVTRKELCEFIMAIDDQRDPSFVSVSNQVYEWLKPKKYSLVDPPEMGIEDSAKKTRDAIADQFLRGTATENTVKDRIFIYYPDGGASDSESEEYKREIVLGLMEDDDTYYWCVGDAEENSDKYLDITETYPIKVINMEKNGVKAAKEFNLSKKLAVFVEGENV